MKQIFAPVLGLALACNVVASPGLAEERVSIGPEDKGQVRILACPMNGSVEILPFRIDQDGQLVELIDDFEGLYQQRNHHSVGGVTIVSPIYAKILTGTKLTKVQLGEVVQTQCTDVTEQMFAIFGY